MMRWSSGCSWIHSGLGLGSAAGCWITLSPSPRSKGGSLALEVVDNHGPAIGFYRNACWRESGRTPIDWGGDQASALIRFEAPSPSSS